MFNKIYQNVWPTAYEMANAKFDDEKLSCVYLCNIVKVLIICWLVYTAVQDLVYLVFHLEFFQ
jgi:hypothetical protein